MKAKDNMHIVRCNIGIWKMEAKVQEIENHKRMAIISAMIQQDHCPVESKHVVVFDHVDGFDEDEETKAVVQRILRKAH
jgi:hypothetical protein